MRIKKSGMYPPLKIWLEDQGYTVYPEIEPRTGGPRADVVAVKGDRLMIVEMKTSFGLAVMEQADYWMSGGYAHQTYIAIPKRDKCQVSNIAQRALDGIGVLQVDLTPNPNFDRQMVSVTIKAEDWNIATNAEQILATLTPYHLNGTGAGS